MKSEGPFDTIVSNASLGASARATQPNPEFSRATRTSTGITIHLRALELFYGLQDYKSFEQKTSSHLDLARDTLCQLRLPFAVAQVNLRANACRHPLIWGQGADRVSVGLNLRRKNR
jgi:hypothetical protein